MSDTHIQVLKKITKIPPIMDGAVKNLSELKVIKYIYVTESEIRASNILEGNKRKLPVVTPYHPTAVGVHMCYDFTDKTIEFVELNSAEKGWGEALVKACIKPLPPDWSVILVFDWNPEFWKVMKEKYPDINWIQV